MEFKVTEIRWGGFGRIFEDLKRAESEAITISLESEHGAASVRDTTEVMPKVIYVDGWPYYPAKSIDKEHTP